MLLVLVVGWVMGRLTNNKIECKATVHQYCPPYDDKRSLPGWDDSLQIQPANQAEYKAIYNLKPYHPDIRRSEYV